MSKAAEIRRLHSKGLTTTEIAILVGCRPEYVRVAAIQRRRGHSKADRKYGEKIRRIHGISVRCYQYRKVGGRKSRKAEVRA